MQHKAVIYCRVSTKEQGDSKLGLEAQEQYCKDFCTSAGMEIVIIIKEVISGTVPLADRPNFMNARNVAMFADAALIVAKQDRISRDEYIWHALSGGHLFGKKGTPKIIVVESPQATPFEMSIRAAVSAEERRLISQRTKAALYQAKLRGKQLGKAGRDAIFANRKDISEATLVACNLYRTGLYTHRCIASELNLKGLTNSKGKPWNMTSVKQLIWRANRVDQS